MAFSALGELDPPRDEWSRIDARLDAILGPDVRVAPVASPPRSLARHFLTSGPFQAAAAVALFAGGVFAGLRFTEAPSAGSETGRTGGGVAAGVPSALTSNPEDRAVFDAMTQLEALRAPLRQVGIGPDGEATGGATGISDMQMLRLSAQLDGLIRATQEGLERSPEDPFASAYLLELLDTRARLAELFESSLHTERAVRW
jgi:hypothetical protein